MFFDIDKQVDKDIDNLRLFDLSKKPKDIAPIDEFEVVYTDEPYSEMSDAELISIVGTTLIFDVECYINFFLPAFYSPVIKKVILMRYPFDCKKLQWILENFILVGFNSRDYDLPLLRLAATGVNEEYLKNVSNWIVQEGIRAYQFEQKFQLKESKINHVDLIEVAPLQGSLKLYSGRLHCKRMQDLPFEHTKILTNEEKQIVTTYCINDLSNTELLMNELAPALELRSEMSNTYNIDLRSRSDAQIAEYVIGSELFKINRVKPKRPEIEPGTKYYYIPPSYLKFNHPILQNALEVIQRSTFFVGEDGYIEMPKEIGELKIDINNCTYRMGMGGLHSCETSTSHIADDNTIIVDRDVRSYYPSIIIKNNYSPKHLGNAYITVYSFIVLQRLAAKQKAQYYKEIGNIELSKYWEGIADSLKITINGSFGKYGNKWSILYAPDLLLQVTITGQLSLLLLIEMIEFSSIRAIVISANTDGVIIKCHKEDKILLDNIVKEWENKTGFETEETRYKAVYSRDVNNYIAIKEDNKHKAKGAFSEKGSAGNSSLSRNPESFVCLDAIIAFVTSATPIEETIRNCRDIRRFVHVRNVRGGAYKSSKYLGKTIRWYYSINCKGIIETYKGHKVPKTEGAMPLMQLSETLPDDINYDYYISETKEIMKNLAIGEIQDIL